MIARTIAPEGLPRPTGDEGHVLLDMIWAYFAGHRTWPTFDDIDRKLYAAGLEFEDVVQQLCPALLRGLDPDVTRTPQGTQQLVLTIVGAANCTSTGPAISTFLAMVRTAATIEPHFRPERPGEQPVLKPQDLKGEPGIDPKLLTKETMFAAAALGMHEPCFGGGGSNAEELEWTLGYGRGIRPFAGVRRLEEYWQIRERVVGSVRTEADNRPYSNRRPEAVAVLAPVAVLPVSPASQESVTMEVTCVLHPLIAEVAANRFRDGHYLDAVVHAFKAVEYRVQTLVGSSEIGARLMGFAMGSATPRITVTRSTGPFLQSEQEGMRDLFKGAMTALRNPRAHGPHFQDDLDEAQEMLAFASFLMRRLDIEDERLRATASNP